MMPADIQYQQMITFLDLSTVSKIIMTKDARFLSEIFATLMEAAG
jgi:hypothetical protein